jgi:hypothetical protein
MNSVILDLIKLGIKTNLTGIFFRIAFIKDFDVAQNKWYTLEHMKQNFLLITLIYTIFTYSEAQAYVPFYTCKNLAEEPSEAFETEVIQLSLNADNTYKLIYSKGKKQQTLVDELKCEFAQLEECMLLHARRVCENKTINQVSDLLPASSNVLVATCRGEKTVSFSVNVGLDIRTIKGKDDKLYSNFTENYNFWGTGFSSNIDGNKIEPFSLKMDRTSCKITEQNPF